MANETDTENPELSHWAEGITVAGNRMTTDEAREFAKELISMINTIESEQERHK